MNTPKRDARAFERWFNEASPSWPDDLKSLGEIATLAFKQLDQPRAGEIEPMILACMADITNFYTAYAAHIASEGA